MMAHRLMMAGGGINVVLSASVRNPDIRALAIAAGWSGASSFTVTVNAGVDVATLSIPNTIPPGLLTIINYGRIGGVANSGAALTVRTSIAVYNHGTICGGGGRGGDGGSAGVWLTYDPSAYSANAYGGSGGGGQGFSTSGPVTLINAGGGSSGTSGSTDRPGSGSGTATGGSGGSGGNWGQPGGPGSAGSYSGSGGYAGTNTGGASGALAGYYIDGNAFVAWPVQGTRLGRVLA